jgi:hypothetical protein
MVSEPVSCLARGRRATDLGLRGVNLIRGMGSPHPRRSQKVSGDQKDGGINRWVGSSFPPVGKVGNHKSVTKKVIRKLAMDELQVSKSE